MLTVISHPAVVHLKKKKKGKFWKFHIQISFMLEHVCCSREVTAAVL